MPTKNRQQSSEIENIERFFTTGNIHIDEFYFKFYQSAIKEGIFKSAFTPLNLIKEINSDCFIGRSKPLQTIKQIANNLEKENLNLDQKCFIYNCVIDFVSNITWLDDDGKEVELKQIKKLLDNELSKLMLKRQLGIENKYDWEKTKKHIDTLDDPQKKIIYLTQIKTEYLQEHSNQIVDLNVVTFDRQCHLEIEKLKTLSKLENHSPNKTTNHQLVLSNNLSKIDFIRIINALSEMRCFTKKNGTYPPKVELMQAFGDVVGIDLSQYTNDLNKAFNTNVGIDKNLEIFDKLKAKTKEWYLNKQNKSTK